MIIVYEKDLFDYRHGEPPEHLVTVLRALDVRYSPSFVTHKLTSCKLDF